jgi:capsular polysaccharide biosynthesis protein
VVLTIEYFDTTIKSPDDVERVLGVPLLGVVPLFAKR